MKRIAPTSRMFLWLATIALAALLPAGCHNAGQTTDTPPGPDTAPSNATSTGPKPAQSVDLARQTEQFAQRLNQQQHAPSPYPLRPRSAPPAQSQQVRWLKPDASPVNSPPPPPPDATNASDTNTTTSKPDAPATLPTLSRDELIKRLADDLKPRNAEQSAALRPWIQRAALAVIDPSYELSADDLKSLNTEDRRLVLAWQRTFAQLGRSLSDNPPNPRSNRSTLIDLADELAMQIESQQPLSIRTLKLCTRVNGYGVYDAIKKPVFLAGTEHPVIVYAELDHFRTKLDARKRYKVQLSQELVLYNKSDGLPVWRQRPVAINDVSVNQRRDFFTVQVIHLSDRLTVGKYILKLRVTDEIGSSVAEASIPLQIVADQKLTTAN